MPVLVERLEARIRPGVVRVVVVDVVQVGVAAVHLGGVCEHVLQGGGHGRDGRDLTREGGERHARGRARQGPSAQKLKIPRKLLSWNLELCGSQRL